MLTNNTDTKPWCDLSKLLDNQIQWDISELQRVGSLFEDGLLLVDYTKRIHFANAAASKMLGEELVNRDFSAIFENEAVDDIFNNITPKSRPQEFIHTQEKGVKRQLRVKLNYMSEEHVAVTVMDMTLRRNLDKVRRDFVANVSHELRSPLTSLIGFIETMRADDEIDTDTRKHFLSIMDEESKRMTRLIDDLISLSRVEVEEHIVPDEIVDISDVTSSVIELFHDRARRQNMDLIFKDELKSNPELSIIHGDRDEIVEVIHNLIENAIKYGYPDTAITIHIAASGHQHLRLGVTNYGEGIEERHIPRLTERFYRVDKARSRQKGGTGLGLAIVKHIINRHRGKLSIQSELGKTTSFNVQLPLAKLNLDS